MAKPQSPKSQPDSLQNSGPATEEQIIARLTALVIHYGRQGMADGEFRVWLKNFCQDLHGKTDAQVDYACARYRRNPDNRFLPTPGQLLALCDSPYADKHRSTEGRATERDGWQPWGGACECYRCRGKVRREGFYRAPDDFAARANAERKELDDWLAYKAEQFPRVLPGESMAAWRKRCGLPAPDGGIAGPWEREPLVMTPELQERERALRAEREAALRRASNGRAE